MISRIFSSVAIVAFVSVAVSCSEDKLDHRFKKYTGEFEFSIHYEGFADRNPQYPDPYFVEDYLAQGSVTVNPPANQLAFCSGSTWDENTDTSDRVFISWDNRFIPIHLNKDGTFKRSQCFEVFANGKFLDKNRVEFGVSERTSRHDVSVWKITGTRR